MDPEHGFPDNWRVVHSLGDSLEAVGSVDKVPDIADQMKHHKVVSSALQIEGFVGTDTLSREWYSMARRRLVGMNSCRSSPRRSRVARLRYDPY